VPYQPAGVSYSINGVRSDQALAFQFLIVFRFKLRNYDVLLATCS
jgi:hypothetical protein